MTPGLKDIKYCTIYKHNVRANSSNIYRYICYKIEICCDTGNGCCSVHKTSKYYQNWCFWVFGIGIILVMYLLCWYCKKIEKERQMEVGINNPRNISGLTDSGLRTVSAGNVNYLLETLIANYRSSLEGDSLHSVVSVDNKSESPPDYVEALNMPRPSGFFQTGNASSAVAPSRENDISDDIPTYDEAVHKI
ncbi:uncharacterized protein LOC143192408 [Rhynchophorus ferrugineus]|uniref:uncharacterized protein LOC143192408 n=1 Tax=Rhynchophorus ferrugineus TaxID=354439 RepID=UPI003FCE68DB